MLRYGYERWYQVVAAGWLVFCFGLLSTSHGVAQAKGLTDFSTANVTAQQLPPQAQDMLKLIYQGGPFRYDKDGTVFGNRERILPAKNRGYYLEYTVKTPSVRTRGARRIICGGVKPAAPDACYYTDDHYASFRQIVQPAGR